MVLRTEIVKFLDEKLGIKDISDTSNNGLQVEGAEDVNKVGLIVDASLEGYQKAKDLGCQMIIVHHGLIWNGIKYVKGRDLKHVKFLLNNEINLYAAHLPLDKHEEWGNNIGLAELLSLKHIEPFGKYKGIDIGFSGELKKEMTVGEIAEKMKEALGGEVTTLPFGKEENKKIGLMSGGGSFALDDAIEQGLDCFITGEGPYHSYIVAKENEINVIYLGHYHSEQLGVKSIGQALEKKFGVETEYINHPPV